MLREGERHVCVLSEGVGGGGRCGGKEGCVEGGRDVLGREVRERGNGGREKGRDTIIL